jgi:hypothetical protein
MMQITFEQELDSFEKNIFPTLDPQVDATHHPPPSMGGVPNPKTVIEFVISVPQNLESKRNVHIHRGKTQALDCGPEFHQREARSVFEDVHVHSGDKIHTPGLKLATTVAKNFLFHIK